MRIMLFFDLPTLTSSNKKAYRVFVKNLKRDGFYMLQESVYVKMALNKQIAEATINKLKKYLPSEGDIMTLVITEKQFASISILLGKNHTDVVNNVDRIVTL